MSDERFPDARLEEALAGLKTGGNGMLNTPYTKAQGFLQNNQRELLQELLDTRTIARSWKQIAVDRYAEGRAAGMEEAAKTIDSTAAAYYRERNFDLAAEYRNLATAIRALATVKP